MMLIKLSYVNWRPMTILKDGIKTKFYEITLPAEITKGGKRTGRTEYVHVEVDSEFGRVLEARRFQLKDKPVGSTWTTGQQFIFGTEEGRYQKGFRRMWHELFKLAGLDYGRDKGLVWHTTRHECFSSLADQGLSEKVIQDTARHRDPRTTRLYMHTDRDTRLSGMVGIKRL